jgi:hypothetical protein
VTPCPHCRALARPEPSRFFGLTCSVCAGPLVEVDAGAADAVVPHLVRAQRSRAMALGWAAAALVFAGMAVMALAFALALGGASRLAALVFLAIGAGAGALVVAGLRRASARNADARAELAAARQRSAA